MGYTAPEIFFHVSHEYHVTNHTMLELRASHSEKHQFHTFKCPQNLYSHTVQFPNGETRYLP